MSPHISFEVEKGGLCEHSSQLLPHLRHLTDTCATIEDQDHKGEPKKQTKIQTHIWCKQINKRYKNSERTKYSAAYTRGIYHFAWDFCCFYRNDKLQCQLLLVPVWVFLVPYKQATFDLALFFFYLVLYSRYSWCTRGLCISLICRYIACPLHRTK